MCNRLIDAVPQVVVGHPNVIAFVQGSEIYDPLDMEFGVQMINNGIKRGENWLLRKAERDYENGIEGFMKRWECVCACMFFGWGETSLASNPPAKAESACAELLHVLAKCRPAYSAIP
jgi:hypothetical protein